MDDQRQQTIDSEYLFRLARKKSEDSRTALAATISDLFEERDEGLSARERTLMFAILHDVILDVELKIRKRLSELLCEYPDAPIELVELLANDAIEVAYPILTRSMVLRDPHLIEIIKSKTLEHKLAIAVRENISERVSQALVNTGDTRIISTLLKNPSARLFEVTMKYLVARAKKEEGLHEPLLYSRNLSGEMAEQMFAWVSAALRQHILTNFDIDQKRIDKLLEQIAQEGVAEGDNSAEVLSEEMENTGRLDSSKLLSALRDGEVPLFVSMFCRMTKLRETLAMRVLFEPGGEGLAITCKAIGIDRITFVEIFTQTRKARLGAMGGLKSDIDQALTLFSRLSQPAAENVLTQWQRNTDYLTALRKLKLDS